MRSAPRGVALMTALLLSMFLLVVGIGFLYFIERDSYMQLQADRMARANYLARSGIEYFAYQDIVDSRYFAANVPRSYALSPQEHFEVLRTSSGECRSRGWLEDSSGRVLAERVLVMPGNTFAGGNKQAMYDANL